MSDYSINKNISFKHFCNLKIILSLHFVKVNVFIIAVIN